jgi:hypothetical protein
LWMLRQYRIWRPGHFPRPLRVTLSMRLRANMLRRRGSCGSAVFHWPARMDTLGRMPSVSGIYISHKRASTFRKLTEKNSDRVGIP